MLGGVQLLRTLLVTPETRFAVNAALGQVAVLMDVVIRACGWCSVVLGVEPAATWGAPGVTSGMCGACAREHGVEDAA